MKVMINPHLYTGKHCHVAIPVHAIPRNFVEVPGVSMNLIIHQTLSSALDSALSQLVLALP